VEWPRKYWSYPLMRASVGRQHKHTLFESEANGQHAKIILVGQPNCGKSTLFNEVAGYRAVTANFAGATVTYNRSHVRLVGRTYDVVDLPGTYSLTYLDEAARETQRYLLTERADVIINVLDASMISRSMELTLQLLELEMPMVLCLNMIDEAERKGIVIDTVKLGKKLGIPVIKTIASRGVGIRRLFISAYQAARTGEKGHHIRGNRDVELITSKLSRELKTQVKDEIGFSKHLLATKLLEQDPYFEDLLREKKPDVLPLLKKYRKQLAHSHGRSSDEVISAERHALSMSISEDVTTLIRPKRHWKDRLDDVLMHSIWGYVFLVGILLLFFNGVFRFGTLVEPPLLAVLERWQDLLLNNLGQSSLGAAMVRGIVQGVGSGLAIVLPYLVPFLFGLAILEDVGYLPRVAFLMDNVMHRIGLHGKAVIPAMLGYGCNVPAVMATRILESPRDRFIAALIASMVPCAARMTIIMGLVGYYLGGNAALGIYLLNIVIIGLSGKVVSRLMPEVTPGMILEIPAYQVPRLKQALLKTWFRLKDFILIALPLLVIGNIILTLAEHYQVLGHINRIISPVTWLLGLPKEVGTTLIFGILKKELSMLMLFQALGTSDVSSVLNAGQILTFTIFVVFYIPCVATIGVLYKQVKAKGMAAIVLFTSGVALVLGVASRGLASLIW